VQADVTVPADVGALVERALGIRGRIDVLVGRVRVSAPDDVCRTYSVVRFPGRFAGGPNRDMNNEFNVDEKNEGSAWVLAVSGELDLRTSPELEDRLDRVWNAGAELVILDLRQIEFMDSTGLRVLLGAHQRAQESGRLFALVRGADQVERVLTLTGVRDLLTVVEAPEELLGAGESASESA
jgi:anti-sigma B factor antagonist